MPSSSKWLKFLGLLALKMASFAIVATALLIGLVALAEFVAVHARAQSLPAASNWRPIGPTGGDVISPASDPRNPDRPQQ